MKLLIRSLPFPIFCVFSSLAVGADKKTVKPTGDACRPVFSSTISAVASEQIEKQQQLISGRLLDSVVPKTYAIPTPDPVFIQLQRMQDASEEITPALVFALLAEERNTRESCNCQPNPLANASVRFVTGINKFFSSLFGRSVTMESNFRKTLGTELAKSHGDMDAINKVISRERTGFLNAFRKSIEADITYAHLYIRTHHLIRSVHAAGKDHLPAYKLIATSDAKTLEIIDLSRQLREVEEAGEIETAASAIPGRYADLSLALRRARHEREDLEDDIQRLRRNARGDEFVSIYSSLNPWGVKADKLELELLNTRQETHDALVRSQEALANLYVAKARLLVLEEMLGGDLNSFHGPIDPIALNYLVTLLTRSESYLGHEQVLGPYYVSSLPTFASEDNASKKYDAIKTLADEWMKIWHGRLLTLTPRLDFNFALTNLSVEFGRFVLSNSIKNQATNIARLGKEAGKIVAKPLAYVWEAVDERLRGEGAAAAEQPKGDRAFIQNKLDDVTKVFEDLSTKSRAQKEDSKISPEQRNEFRDKFGILAAYIMRVQALGESLPMEFEDLLGSPKGMDILNWSCQRRNADIIDGEYSSLVLETIMAAQIKRLARYEKLGPEILENAVVWTLGVATSYGVVELTQWVAGLFN